MPFDPTKLYEPKPFLDLFSLDLKEPVTFENSDAVIIPFGYEGTVTFGHGTDKGPAGLIQASAQVETFDDELLDDIHNQIKIWTTPQPDLPKEPEEACNLLAGIVSDLISKRKFPVLIGGEHSISYGFAQALSKNYKDISVLVFDSHMDLGDQWSKGDFTHASWLKYSLSLPNIRKAALFGIRNFNKLEYKYWMENKEKVSVFLAKEKASWQTESILDSLTENVFISFDIDAFDSSVMPATGTPEPGGLFWNETLSVLREVCAKKNVIGMDLVELAPIENFHAPDFLAAKLLMKMILYKFRAKKLA
ncbi:MAG: agmatinase [Candidatus Doudnabacteria bacterium]|nr:agmatinase [Candidatus Doudnabacteria bacterium]